MAEYYPKGYKIPLANGSYAEIIQKLGEGGQGVVYRVAIGGKEYALKWYHKGAVQNPKKFYQNLENASWHGSFNYFSCNRFLFFLLDCGLGLLLFMSSHITSLFLFG